MTKPLSTLISEACDVEEAAYNFAVASDVIPDGVPNVVVDDAISKAFKAGAAAVSKRLGPALMEATNSLELYPEEPVAKLSLIKIRAILEGGVDE